MDQSYLSNNSRLFPTTASFLIFWSYISLFVSQGLLVTAVQRSRIDGFNAIVVVLLTELVKLLICTVVYLIRSQGNLLNLIRDIRKNNRLILLYLIPSFLYCLYNNLTFINLELFDLTTYYCLMQFRIVLTAVIYQIVFRRKLTSTQWTSLIILTLGCFIKQYGLYDDITNKHHHHQTTTSTTGVFNDSKTNLELNFNSTGEPRLQSHHHHSATKQNSKEINNPLIHFLWLTLLLLLQMFCSCFAGVYNEFLLKDSSTANSADVILQNIFMYLDSILCNILVFNIASTNLNKNVDKIPDDFGAIATLNNLLAKPLVLILVLNNAFSGLVASFFIKSLNSILKTFASALELFAVAILAWVLFGIKIDIYTVVALFLVSAAMIVYSKNPVSVGPPSRDHNKDGFMLLPTSDEKQ